MWILLPLACVFGQDVATDFAGGNVHLYVTDVRDDCTDGDLVDTFAPGGIAATPSFGTLDVPASGAAPADGTFDIDALGSASVTIDDGGDGTFIVRNAGFGTVTVDGCSVGAQVDGDFLPVDDVSITGQVRIDLSGTCAAFLSNPCTVGVDVDGNL